MSRSTLTPYVDGWNGPEPEITVIPRPKFPFKESPIPDVYTRMFERDYRVHPQLFELKIAVRTSWTNLLTQSEDFTNSAWTKTNLTPSAGTLTSPDGQTVVNKLLETVTNGEHSVTQAATTTAVVTELTVFAAAGLTREWLRLSFTDSAATTFSAFFNVASGILGTRSAGVTANILPCGYGIFRCIITFTPAAGAGTFKANVASSASVISYAGTTSAGLNLWGAQISAGVETPYVSTTTTTRTISAPNRDKLDPFSYLIREEDPQVVNSEQATARRVFSRVPLSQTIPGSMFITKPSLTGTFPQVMGDSLVLQPDPTVPRYVFYTQRSVTSDSGPPGSGAYPTGGTYTLSCGGQTTSAIAFGASASTVQTELNALSYVTARGGVVVTGSYTAGFSILWNVYPTGSLDATGLTTTVGSTATSINTVNRVQVSIRINALTGTFNGGTFTITVLGQTTAAIAYSASLATVKTELEALSNIGSGGIYICSNPGSSSGYSDPNSILNNSASQIGIAFEISQAAITADGSALTPTGSTAAITTGTAIGGNTGFYRNLRFTGVVLATRILGTDGAHGLTAATDDIVLTQGEEYQTIGAGLYSVTSDTITLTVASGSAFASTASVTAVGKQSGEEYTGGLKLTRIKRVTDYYLPGVTPGITTMDDVPLPTFQGDDASLLEAIFAGSTSINYEVGDLTQWRDSPILCRTTVTLNASTL